MELNSAQLASLSGDYRMPDGSLLSLRLEGDQITTNGVPFLTVSENRLEAPTFGAVIEFERDSSDNISGAVLQLAGVVSRTTRIEPTKWTADQLAAVEGSYYSQELDTGYLLQADGDSLSAHHSSHGRIPLRPLGPDEFASDHRALPQLHLQRNSARAATSLIIDAGRVQRLVFDRQN